MYMYKYILIYHVIYKSGTKLAGGGGGGEGIGLHFPFFKIERKCANFGKISLLVFIYGLNCFKSIY